MKIHTFLASVFLFLALIINSGYVYGGNKKTSQRLVTQGLNGFIRVGTNRNEFICSHTGARFIAWGVNYDHDVSGRLLEDYWNAEWPTVIGDFIEMKEMGANVVRIHPQLSKFMESPEKPDKAALKQLRKLVELAQQTGLYLDITGLGCYHIKDVPLWYNALDEVSRWNVQARFWEALAETCSKSPAIFCYDLMNEPILPGENEKETDWLTGEFDGEYFVQRISLDLAGRKREQVAKAWVDKLTAAIRKKDKRHLITVGVIPWVYVFPQAKPLFYSKEVAENLDFVSVHFYPKKGDIENALKALKAYDIGKPLVIEEMFPLECSQDEMDSFIEGSRGFADGWISFYWGKSITDYGDNNLSLSDSVTKSWFQYFRSKAQEIIYTGRNR